MPSWIFIAVAVLVLALVYMISEWGWGFLVSPLLLLVGLSLFSFGVGAVITRRTDLSDGAQIGLQQSRSYTGLSAVIDGLLFILLGVLLSAGSVVRQLGVWEPVWSYLKANPGWLLGNIGIFLLLVSMLGLLGHREETQKTWLFVATLPRRIVSVVGIVLAFLLIAVGLLEILYQPGFDAFFHMLQNLLPKPPTFDG